MRLYYSIIFFLWIAGMTFQLSAQENKPKKGINGNLNLKVLSENTSTSKLSISKQLELNIYPDINFYIIGNRLNYHYFGISKILFLNTTTEKYDMLGTPISGSQDIYHYLSIKYQYDLVFLKDKETGAKPFLGVSGSPFYERNKVIPVVATSFPTTSNEYGIVLSFHPGIKFISSDNLYLNTGLSLEVFSFSGDFHKTDNPKLSDELKTTGGFKFVFDLPTSIILSIGLGLNF